MSRPHSPLLPQIIDFAVLFFCLTFSTWLMWHTFHSSNGQIQIAGKAWSDFASHIPLIRSFSLGPNFSQFPPQFPLFPGPPIRYHFLFYAGVGLLEKLGLPLVFALNLPSLTGFTFLTFLIYLIAKKLFHSRLTGLLALLLFLANSSTSWYYFFQKQGFTLPAISQIFTNQEFPAFAPYDGGLVTGGFWNLNVFTNQRHFALALCLPLLLLYLFTHLKRDSLKLALLAGVATGLMPFVHGAVFIITLAFLATLFLITPFKKTLLLTGLIAAVLALPQFLLFRSDFATSPPFHLFLGYLAGVPHFTLEKFFTFWLLNLGPTIITLPVGLILAPRSTRKYFLPFLSLFIIANLFQFSPDISVNHKFFNLFIIGANLYSAFFLTYLLRRKLPQKLLAFLLLFFLTLSGFIDFWPIKNDHLYTLASWQDDPTATWIQNHTPKSAVFLNNTYLYHPASLVGRYIYMGWPYFAWSAGYDTYTRDNQMKRWFLPHVNKDQLCHEIQRNHIDFIILNTRAPDFPTDFSFFKTHFLPVFASPDNQWVIYSIADSCSNP